MPVQQRGPRGERVTVVVWDNPERPHEINIEVYASAGVRPGTHTSAADRQAELLTKGMNIIGAETHRVK